MTETKSQPTMPDRDALRALYDAAVGEINTTRTNPLVGAFYTATADAVFEAGYLALSDYCNGRSPGTRRVHVVSAPAGGGKTSFSYAFIAAVTRYAEANTAAPYGCLFVVDQMPKADDAYKELNALMPGQVSVWTTEHDPACKERNKVPTPAATFTKEELRRYPVAVVTHAFYNGTGRHNALNVWPDGYQRERAMVIVDERPEEVEVYETTLQQAQSVREELEAKRPDLRQELEKLLVFIMASSWTESTNSITNPTDVFGLEYIAAQLDWFTTPAADYVVRDYKAAIPGLDQLFGLAKAMSQGLAFASQSGTVVYFVGWRPKLMVRPGTVLLDATADIDGLTQICPWRKHAKVPVANYANLEIIHVPRHTTRKLSEYLKTAANRRAYADWMVETIKQNMAPGEQGLVVCKKILFDNENVPQWPQGDPRFKDRESYGKRHEWNIEGRMLCATHYGTGIGSNEWKEDDVVFLFDEFHIPVRIAAATVHGLRGQRADEGDLASMSTIGSKAPSIQIFRDGHRLRWTKQLALRGGGRFYDAAGNCGKQRLVISSDLKTFAPNITRLFPGVVNIRTLGDTKTGTLGEQVIKTLSGIEGVSELTSPQLSKLMGRKWGTISTRVRTPEFERSLTAIGWRYDPGKGRRVSVFRRTSMIRSQAA